MVKARLSDVNMILMEQLERLNDDVETCKTIEGIEREVARSKAMVDISEKIISIANTQLEAIKVAGEYNYVKKDMPLLLQ